MSFKKITSIVLATLMVSLIVAGCAKSDNKASKVSAGQGVSSTVQPKTKIKIGTLKGPSGLGMVKLMSDSDNTLSSNSYEFVICSSPNEIVSKISSGEVDAASAPTNLAATLYNKTNGNVQIAAIDVLGVLYIVTNGAEIKNIKDLKGQTIYSSGKGSIPEYALNFILEKNGLEVGKDVKVEYKANHTELATFVATGKAKIALLPEPFVTNVQTKNDNLKVALNMTEQWDKAVNSDSVLTMGCVIVRKDFVEKNKAAFNQFLEEYKKSTQNANQNVEDTASLSEKYGIMPAAVVKKAIKNCNITYIDGAQLKSKAENFLDVLFKANPKSIGGKMPSEDFYYKK